MSENEKWFFFEGGSYGLNKLQQVCFLVEECGWSEDSAMEMIYGPIEGDYNDFDY